MKAIRWISPLFTFCRLWLHFSHALSALLAPRVVRPWSGFWAEVGSWGRGTELGAERTHLLIVNRTELTDLGPTASTYGTELCVLKSTRLIELSLGLTDMDNLLLAGPVLPGLAHNGGVLAPLHGAELVGWLATTLELSSLLAACRAELLVWLSTMLTLLLSTVLSTMLSTMLSRVKLTHLLN